MLDPKFVRDNIIKIKASETKRGHGTKFLEAFLKNDEFWRKSKAKNEKLKQTLEEENNNSIILFKNYSIFEAMHFSLRILSLFC